jgi:hypothetical protein
MQQYKKKTLLRTLIRKQMKQHTPHEHCREVTIFIAFVHHQSSHSPSSLRSRNRPSLCIHHITHHMATGSGCQTAQHHTTTGKLHLGQQDLAVSLSLSLGNQPFAIAVGKPKAWWGCWPPNINHHTVISIIVWPAHTIYSWRFGITEGGTKALRAYRQSLWSSLNDTNLCVSSSNSSSRLFTVEVGLHTVIINKVISYLILCNKSTFQAISHVVLYTVQWSSSDATVAGTGRTDWTVCLSSFLGLCIFPQGLRLQDTSKPAKV